MPTNETKPPMGATVGENGTDFRVWAPHATAVSVVGSFNDWKPEAHPMERDDQGCWHRLVAEAKAGDEYRFLLKTPQGDLSRIDPYARDVTSSVGNGVVVDPAFHWKGDDFKLETWNRLVIYELHIGTFGETAGDDEFRPADFKSAARKLSHLKKLGVTAVEIMPVAEFAGDVSWGYNPAHIFAVESAYGGPAAFKTFIRECHRLGMAVILDVVYNHFGPSDIDLWRFDGWSENDGGGIYFYNDWKAETPWGATRPDYGRAEVRRFIVDNALFWLEEYHLDGLRLDMSVYIRTVKGPGGEDLPEGFSLLQELNRQVQERFPGRITIAEDLQDNEWLTKDVGAGGAGFGSQWDARFVHPIRAAVTNPTDEGRSMSAVAAAIAIRDNDDACNRVIYSESHDEVANGKARVPYEINQEDPKGWHAQKRSTLAAVLIFTAPGLPMLFQGQEFLEGEWFRDTVPVDWDSSDEFRGIVRLYRDLIALRLDHKGSTGGLCGQHIQILHVNETDKVISFRRWEQGGPGDVVVVIANFSHEAVVEYNLGFPAAGRWLVRFDSDWSGYGENFEGRRGESVLATEGEYDGMPCQAKVSIAAYSAVILSQDPA